MKHWGVFFFCILFTPFCKIQKERLPWEYLFQLYTENSPKAIFSYPGRTVEFQKKREVLSTILDIINTTKETLYIYAYSFNHPEILEALKKLKETGVRILVILDKDKKYDEFYELKIPYRIWEKSGLHHLKIIISDDRRFFLGTGNFSKYGLTNDWNGYLDIPISRVFSEKLKLNLEEKKMDVVLIEKGIQYLFSPDYGTLIQDTILEELSLAKKSIQVLAFDHYDEIFSSVLKKKSSEGTHIDVVYNDPVDPEAYYLNEELFGFTSGIFRDGNSDTADNGDGFPEGGLLHHKTILIDDKILLTGSFNFSLNARDKNREIFLKTSEYLLVNEFKKEFNRIKQASYSLKLEKRNWKPSLAMLDLNWHQEKVCTSEKIGSSTIEVGSGVFKSILRYDRLKPSNCFSFSSYEKISSGISSFTSEKPIQSPFLWETFNIQKRRGEEIYIPISLHPSVWIPNQLIEFSSIDFSLPNKIILKLKTNLLSDTGDIYYYSPSFDLRKGKYTGRGNRLEIDFSLSTEEKEKGSFFIFDDKNLYYGCFTQSGKSDTLNYLLNKIKFKLKKDNGEDCLGGN
jgi:phosphatidylserine/phosphatidylglycerophosphate/cardiolipin synthase-like enzyme